ncbi:hypothetical protein ACWEKM_36245 [Streptomyces sp. NPDC004752]
MAAEEGFQEPWGLLGKVRAAAGTVASVLGRDRIAVVLAGRAGDGLSATLARRRRRRAGRLHQIRLLVPGTGRCRRLLPPHGRLPRFHTLPAELFLAGEAAFFIDIA